MTTSSRTPRGPSRKNVVSITAGIDTLGRSETRDPDMADPPNPEDARLLADLAARCAANLAASERAQAYLRSQGVVDEAVWAKYRIGIGDAAWLKEMDAAALQRLKALKLVTWNNRLVLAGSGVVFPTYDPREPEKPVGFVRQTDAQNTHRWATEPKGVACSRDASDHAKIILADNPLLTLRLAQHGSSGVVLCESPEVLPALKDWLSAKELVAASYRSDRLADLAAALNALGLPHRALKLSFDLERTSAETLALVGIDKEALLAQEPPPKPVTPRLIHELVEYAKARVKAGEGLELLKTLKVDDAELLDAHEIGYLPSNFFKALTDEDRRSITGHRLGNALILPARDENGVAVDLHSVWLDRGKTQATRLMREPLGLLGSKVAKAYPELIIVESFGALAAMFASGTRNVLLLRGEGDAKVNATRLYDAGVRCVKIAFRRSKDAEAIAAELSIAGIATEIVGRAKRLADMAQAPVEAPAALHIKESVPEGHHVQEPAAPVPQPECSFIGGSAETAPANPTPTLVSHDAKSGMAKFQVGDATYLLEITPDAGEKIQVRLERGEKFHLDCFDLAVEAQRQRFAKSGALRTQVHYEDILEHLLALFDEARRIRDEAACPVVSAKPVVRLTDAEKQQAVAFLKQPDLLDAIAEDLAALGLAGEDRNKRLLYLIATSRKLERPLSAALRAPLGTGKSFEMETISALMPVEDVVHVSRLTDSSLYYADGLAHRLLLIDEADALSPEVIVALRVLQSRGALSQAHTERDAGTGRTQTRIAEMKGPVAVFTSTVGKVEEQLLSRCYEVSVDDSPEQTARILEAQRRLRTDAAFVAAGGIRERVTRKHHALQRMLEPRAVVIPYANRIEFPNSSVRHRREQEKFLNLIEASCLLHQHQRMSENGVLIADERDFENAVRLSAETIGRAGDELDGNARDVLELIMAKGCDRFSLNELRTLRPDWTRHRLYSGLEELARLEVVISTRGRGKVRQYELVKNAAKALSAPTVRLGELSKLSEPLNNNFTPRAATG